MAPYLQGTGNATLGHLVRFHQLAVKSLVDNPQHRQHTQCTQERCQLRDVVEGGNKPQSTNTHNQHHDALPAVQTGIVATIGRRIPRGVEPVGQLAVYQDGGNHPCQQRWNQQIGRETACRHGSVTPQNQSRGIANDGKTSPAVGSQHDGRTDEHSLARVLQDVVHDDEHHGCRREVIEIG